MTSLILGMLIKDPVQRFSWSEIAACAFWQNSFLLEETLSANRHFTSKFAAIPCPIPTSTTISTVLCHDVRVSSGKEDDNNGNSSINISADCSKDNAVMAASATGVHTLTASPRVDGKMGLGGLLRTLGASMRQRVPRRSTTGRDTAGTWSSMDSVTDTDTLVG